MNNSRVIRSFQFGEIIDMPKDSYFKNGFVFTLTDKMLESWKIGHAIEVSDSYRTFMVPARNIRAFITEHIEVQTDIIGSN